MIIVTLTTIPPRLNSDNNLGIKSCINSLLDQSIDDYEIHFNIPVKYKYTDEEYRIPDWLIELTTVHPKFKIFTDVEDRGPVTKLLPTVKRSNSLDDIIIVVDDDLVYHNKMVEEQINNQNKWERAAIGYDGLRSRDENGLFSRHFKDVRDYFYTSNYRDSRVDILQHYKSVSYKRNYFEEDFFDFVDEYYSWSDDLLLAAYMSYKKIDRIVTYYIDDPKFNSLKEWQNGGGVTTFPVIRHTHHGGEEGCNLFRLNKDEDNHQILYSSFIDKGYVI